MFVTTCPSLTRLIAVTDEYVESRTPTPHGTAIQFACPCGGWGIYLSGPGPISDRLALHSPYSAAA
jgi:hypothetical protein